MTDNEARTRDEVFRCIIGQTADRATEAILDLSHYLARAVMADAWDEGHRFTGYEPECGENPYRSEEVVSDVRER